MSDAHELAKRFLEKSHTTSVQKVSSESTGPMSSFRSLFAVKELSREERELIGKLLEAHVFSDNEKRFEQDLRDLTQITAELKSIEKQAVVLVGERIAKAREILKHYGDKQTFTQWLDTTFQSRKTAYNALAFYDLYQELSTEDLREQFKKMPMKASYILASRQGALDVKEGVIKSYSGESQQETIEAIQEKLPLDQGDKRVKQAGKNTLVDDLEKVITKLGKQKEHFSYEDLEKIRICKANLEKLLGEITVLI